MTILTKEDSTIAIETRLAYAPSTMEIFWDFSSFRNWWAGQTSNEVDWNHYIEFLQIADYWTFLYLTISKDTYIAVDEGLQIKSIVLFRSGGVLYDTWHRIFLCMIHSHFVIVWKKLLTYTWIFDQHVYKLYASYKVWSKSSILNHQW